MTGYRVEQRADGVYVVPRSMPAQESGGAQWCYGEGEITLAFRRAMSLAGWTGRQ